MKLPKFGPFSLFVAITLWIAIISVQTHEQIQMTLDGSIFAKLYFRGTDGHSASASKLRFFAFTLLTCITLAYLMLMRLLMDRSRRCTRIIFFLGTTILCLLQLPFLISATTLLIQYIRVEGITPMRIGGLVYAVVGLIALFAVSIWAFLQCMAKGDSKKRLHVTANRHT
jgi:Domain of unknown function (DUF4173)